jgi:chromosome segregation ATPase
VRALEVELREASAAPSTSTASPNRRVLDLEEQLHELKLENVSLRSLGSGTTLEAPTRVSSRKPRSSSFGGNGASAVADLAASEVALQSARAKLATTERDLMAAQNKLAALERSSARELEHMRGEVAEAKDEVADLRRDLFDRDDVEARLSAQHEAKLATARERSDAEASEKLRTVVEEQTAQREVLSAHLADAMQRIADLTAEAEAAAARHAGLHIQLDEADALRAEHESLEMRFATARDAAEALREERDALLRRAAEAEAKEAETTEAIDGMREAACEASVEAKAARERQAVLEEQLQVCR